MGIDTHVYTFYGVKIDNYDDQLSEKYDEFYDDADCPYVLWESLTGTYMVFGVLLYRSTNFRFFKNDEDKFNGKTLENIAEMGQKYKENFINKFGEKYAHYVDKEFTVFSFLHFS